MFKRPREPLKLAKDIVKICEQIKQKKETNSVEPTTSIPAHGSMGDAESL